MRGTEGASLSAVESIEGQSVVAGRYAVLDRLGAGGMGVVYRVRDESTGRIVALKQLLASRAAEKRSTLEALLQREFHTLAGLRHPRIIEVYDYGHAAQGPYYTMELLSGKGLREIAPLSYREACSHVRDVASSLALLHARRLIHRDVSPGNVRLSSDGRAKLIDFGALATFGVREDIIGTAPYVAPEVLRWLPLDQRTDLFSLGAVLYWALTGRHAYPARRLEELLEVWQNPPPPPSSFVPDLPPALDDLVTSLLSMDPLARPASAALVIERLNAVAELEPESEEHASESYLLSSPMVGREGELARVMERMDAAIHGKGGAILVEGPSGIGKSRLLQEVCVRAQLSGATVIRASGTAAVDAFSLVNSLIANLFHVGPDIASAAPREPLGVLGHVSAVLREKFAPMTLDALPSEMNERRACIQGALHAWFLSIARIRPLVIVVDDVQAADANSAAFLAALARESGSHPLLVLAAQCRGIKPTDRTAVRALQRKSERVNLSGLQLGECETLIEGLFGRVSNTGRVASWIQDRSGGHPKHCMELVQLLVKRRIARYVDGAWILPIEISSEELPSRLDELLEARLTRLEPHARMVAEALAMHGRPLLIEQCLPLLGDASAKSVHAALDQLVAEEILVCEELRYRFLHDGMRSAVLRRIDAAERQRMHLTLGEALMRSGDGDARSRLEAVRHLIAGGSEARAAAVLAKMGLKSLRENELGDEPELVMRTLSEMLSVYEKQQRSLLERAPLLLTLAPLSYYVDWRLACQHEKALEIGFHITGLALASKLRRYLGARLALLVALGIAAVRFRRARSFDIPYNLREAIADTCAIVPTLAGVYAIALDVDGMRRLMALIEPLRLLGREHVASAVWDYCASRLSAVQGREVEALSVLEPNAARLATTQFDAAIGEHARKAFHCGEVVTIGIIKTSAFGDESCRIADSLDQLHSRLWSTFADQIRLLYHANRGRLDRVREYQDKIELNVVQGGLTWQTDIFVPTMMLAVSLMTGDLVAVRLASEQLARRARDFSSLEPYAEAAHAGYLMIRGNLSAAIARLPALLLRFPARGRAGWVSLRWIYADALNRKGEHARAREVVLEALAATSPADHAFALPYAELVRQHALAEAGLGNFAEAVRILEQFLAERGAEEQLLVTGLFHKARAEVALAMQDAEAFRQHLSLAESLFKQTHNPSLIAQWQRLARAGERARLRAPSAIALDESTSTRRRAGPEVSAFSRLGAGTLEEQWDRSLGLIVQEADAQAGYLYVLRADRLALVAAAPSGEPPEAVQAELSELVNEARARYGKDRAPETTGPRLAAAEPSSDSEGDLDSDSHTRTVFNQSGDQRRVGTHCLMVLTNESNAGTYVVGGIVLTLESDSPKTLVLTTLQGVARSLSAVTEVSSSS